MLLKMNPGSDRELRDSHELLVERRLGEHRVFRQDVEGARICGHGLGAQLAQELGRSDIFEDGVALLPQLAALFLEAELTDAGSKLLGDLPGGVHWRPWI